MPFKIQLYLTELVTYVHIVRDICACASSTHTRVRHLLRKISPPTSGRRISIGLDKATCVLLSASTTVPTTTPTPASTPTAAPTTIKSVIVRICHFVACHNDPGEKIPSFITVTTSNYSNANHFGKCAIHNCETDHTQDQIT